MSTKELDIGELEDSFIEYCNRRGYEIRLDYGIQVTIHDKKTLSRLNFKVHFFKLMWSNNIDVLLIYKRDKYNIISYTDSTFEIKDYNFQRLFNINFDSENSFNENIINIIKKIDKEHK